MKGSQLELKMVAGMVMPLADLRAIYELLFRDGVVVAKNDKRPQSMHPDLKGITNLKVMRAMGSLKSKGCVRENFAWKHAYYYITNEGIAYLRDYLQLPPEIVPAPLQRVRRPVASAQVQMVSGPTSYTPKPKLGRESREPMTDRHIYRHKRVGEESERPPKNFRGSYQCDSSVGPPGVQTFSARDEHWAKKDHGKSSVEKAVVTKFSGEIPAVRTTPAAFKDSQSVKMQKVTIKEMTEDLIPAVTRGETSNQSLEALGEREPEVDRAVVVRQTIPSMAELAEREEKQNLEDKEDVPEEVVVTDTLDHDSATPPSSATDDFRHLTTQELMKKTIPHVASDISSSAAFETTSLGPVVPSDGPLTAPKTTQLQEGQGVLTEDQDAQRICPDFLKGLSSSSFILLLLLLFLCFLFCPPVCSIRALLWAPSVFGNSREDNLIFLQFK